MSELGSAEAVLEVVHGDGASPYSATVSRTNQGAMHFEAVRNPSESTFEELAAHDPGNPFVTNAYIRSRVALGEKVCLLRVRNGSGTVTSCPVFLKGGFLKRRLQIVSLPTLPCPDLFWAGLVQLCCSWGVWLLQVDSYGSLVAKIPELLGEMHRHHRVEYVLDLDHDVFDVPSHNHRRDIARARKLGLVVKRSSEVEACRDHTRLMAASMNRRTERGEHLNVELDPALPEALLANGAGELFQAVRGGEVLASLLVLRSKTGGYYHSAGNSPQGMKWGASPFLLASVADILKNEGAEFVNIGGTGPENAGLMRFKSGFGAREIPLQSACFCPGSLLRREIRHTACWVHQLAGTLAHFGD